MNQITRKWAASLSDRELAKSLSKMAEDRRQSPITTSSEGQRAMLVEAAARLTMLSLVRNVLKDAMSAQELVAKTLSSAHLTRSVEGVLLDLGVTMGSAVPSQSAVQQALDNLVLSGRVRARENQLGQISYTWSPRNLLSRNIKG